MKRIRSVFLLSLICMILFSFSASAEQKQLGSIREKIDTVQGMEFYLYRIGEYAQSEIRLAEQYAAYKVDLESKSAAAALAAYVQRDEMTPDFIQTTDETGLLLFDELEVAAYLMVGTPKVDGDKEYRATPVIVTIPQRDEQGNQTFDVEIKDKFLPTHHDKPASLSVKAQKVWKDEGKEDARPKDITVQLLCDGNVASAIEDAEVVLTKENNWSYLWEDLDDNHEWIVMEKDVPDGYEVSVEKVEGKDGEIEVLSVILTNQLKKPGGEEGGNPPGGNSGGGGGKIPQTGQLWWPVGILASVGLFFILIGLIFIQKKERSE